jgi:hypothetical protein
VTLIWNAPVRDGSLGKDDTPRTWSYGRRFQSITIKVCVE